MNQWDRARQVEPTLGRIPSTCGPPPFRMEPIIRPGTENFLVLLLRWITYWGKRVIEVARKSNRYSLPCPGLISYRDRPHWFISPTPISSIHNSGYVFPLRFTLLKLDSDLPTGNIFPP